MAVTVRAAAQGAGASVSSQACAAFSSDPVSTELIAVIQSTFHGAGAVTHNAPTDSVGTNTYTQIGSTFPSQLNAGFQISMWYAKNINGGSSFVVTGHTASTVDFLTVVAYALSGADTTAPYNGDVGNAFQQNPPTTTDAVNGGTTIGTPAANSLAIDGCSTGGPDANLTVGTSWALSTNGTQTNNTSFQDLYTETRTISATVNGNWTCTVTTGQNIGVTASFKPAGSTTPTDWMVVRDQPTHYGKLTLIDSGPKPGRGL